MSQQFLLNNQALFDFHHILACPLVTVVFPNFCPSSIAKVYYFE